jgi:uroporphyrinogen-III C-methyltransferase
MNSIIKRVSLVGVGPGDEDLLTLKAINCIESGDVIIYDNLINPTILNNIKDNAKLIYAGKIAGSHYLSQGGINEYMKEYALQGKYVVRLKGGDPYIFGRGGEEAEYLLKNHLDFEIVHGVSSFYSALGYAGIPITHRDCNSEFHVFTGHSKNGEPSLDFKKIAGLSGSLVFLMGLSNIRLIAEELIKNGMSPYTKAAIIENGTRYNQREFRGELGAIAKIAEENTVSSPAIIVIGNVCEKNLHFFFRKGGPLCGKSILLTATKALADRMEPVFKNLGANVCKMSLISVKAVKVNSKKYLSELNLASHIVFTSASGVEFFWKKNSELNIDIRTLWNKKICVIGSGSSEALKRYGINADFIPSSFDSSTFLKEVKKELDATSHVLMLRAREGNDTLPKGLEAAGISYSDIPLYETTIDHRRKFELNKELKKTDYVVVASGSAANALYEMTDDRTLLNEKVVSIGPVTTKKLRELGINEKTTALKYNVDGIIDAIIEN